MAELETYYNFHKSLISVLGLWPHNRSKFSLIRKTMISLLLVSIIVPQCLAFTVSDITPNLMLNVLSPITMCLGALVKYTVFWYQSDVIEGFLDKVEYDWNLNRDDGLQILKQHASLGKYYGKLLACFIYAPAVGLVLLDVSTCIAYIITRKNDTFNFPLVAEYLIDERKYYLPIVVHRSVAILSIATTFVATESIFIMLLQHSGSLFIVTGREKWKPKHLGDQNWPLMQGIKEFELLQRRAVGRHIKENVLYQRIVKAVTQDSVCLNSNNKSLINDSKATLITAIVLHSRAMKFASTLLDKNRGSYSVLIILGVLSLSSNLYRVSQSAFDVADLDGTIIALIFVSSEMAYMFYVNSMVQQMTDCAASLVPSVYNSNWYEASLTVQKSVLLILLEGTNEYDFNIFGLYCVSIEGFSVLLQKSVSCLMIMISMQ